MSLALGCATSAFDDLTARDELTDPSTTSDAATPERDADATASDAGDAGVAGDDASRPGPPSGEGSPERPAAPDAGTAPPDAGPKPPTPSWPDPTVADERAIERIRDVYVEWCDVKQARFSGAVCRVFSDARITAATRMECIDDILFACGNIAKPVVLCDRPSTQCVPITLP